jgi:hypothetical protein
VNLKKRVAHTHQGKATIRQALNRNKIPKINVGKKKLLALNFAFQKL